MKILTKTWHIVMLMYIVDKTSGCNYYTSLQFIKDYVNWRNIKHIVIIDKYLTKDCNKNPLKYAFNFLSSNDISISFQSKHILPLIKDKFTVVVFADDMNDNFFSKAEKTVLNPERLSWLIIVTHPQCYNLNNLRFLSFDFDTDLVIACSINEYFLDVKDSFQEDTTYLRNTTNYNENQNKIYNKLGIQTIFFPLLLNEYNGDADIKNFCEESLENVDVLQFCLLQIYSIRKNINTSLAIFPLGYWNYLNGTTNMYNFQGIETRNLNKFSLIFGTKNLTKTIKFVNEEVIQDDSDGENLFEFLSYFTSLLNASEKIVVFSKLGYKDGTTWTDLLGAVILEEVDIALGSVIKTSERSMDLAFTHNIMTSMRNIYVKPEETNELRDIFLIPFDNRLIICVVAIGIILALIVSTTNAFTTSIINGKNEQCLYENFRIADSFMWSIAILSMQGSIWRPLTYSGNVIVIISLAFSLIIFNSYSAFITSVLSVDVLSIRSVSDLLQSNYEIGYVKNSQDEIFLRSMNSTHLKQIYLKGYLDNTVRTIGEGLRKAAEGNYGFFASGQVARKELCSINNYKCIDRIVEIPVKSTINTIAFPMSKSSPYRKLINLSIIKMYETGVYKYLHAHLIPPISKCTKTRLFRSADLPGLSTAFFLLFFGQILALIILLFECIWRKQRKLYMCILKYFRFFKVKENISAEDEINIHFIN